MRIDKWLWAARFFKTRSLATHACDLGRIKINGVPSKPAKEIKEGDRLSIKTEAGEFVVDVLGLSQMRGPAAQAQTLYREDEAGRQVRLALAEERKAMAQLDGYTKGRPGKKDRRRIIGFRQSF
jgi:ribosome-associated heat shock protein Hsp15